MLSEFWRNAHTCIRMNIQQYLLKKEQYNSILICGLNSIANSTAVHTWTSLDKAKTSTYIWLAKCHTLLALETEKIKHFPSEHVCFWLRRYGWALKSELISPAASSSEWQLPQPCLHFGQNGMHFYWEHLLLDDSVELRSWTQTEGIRKSKHAQIRKLAGASTILWESAPRGSSSCF